MKNATRTLCLTIKDLSINHDNRKFVLHVSGFMRNGAHVQAATSAGMLVIRHRLTIKGKDQLPRVWFKDEGGRENCIEMCINLIDSTKMNILNKKVQLRLTLLYESGLIVPRQDVLKLNPDSKMFIDDSGSAVIKFRIEEVSRSHQKQLFCIQVSPDTSQYPMASDVSPDISYPIEVLSKRNNTRSRDATRDLVTLTSSIVLADSDNRPSKLMRKSVSVTIFTLVPYAHSLMRILRRIDALDKYDLQDRIIPMLS